MLVRISDDSPVMMTLKEAFYEHVSFDAVFDDVYEIYYYEISFSGHHVGRSGYIYRQNYFSLYGCKDGVIDRDEVLKNDVVFLEFVQNFFRFFSDCCLGDFLDIACKVD